MAIRVKKLRGKSNIMTAGGAQGLENGDKIKAVQKMQDYINANIANSITLVGLARAANYSVWHSARIFKQMLGKTPFEYIRSLRLTEAAKRLREGKTKVIDVAFDFVFDSHEGFTRAFTKEFGLSPYSYKKNPVPLKYFIPFRLTNFNLTDKKRGAVMESKQKQFIFTQVVERPKRKAIIKRGVKATHYFEYCEEVGCDIWGILESVKDALFEPAGFWLPEKLIKCGTSQYVQGVEISADYNGPVPEGFEVIELEPCKFLVFQGEPFDDEDFEQAIEGVMEAIERFNPEIYGYRWCGDAPSFQLAPLGYRGYIEAKPINEIKR